MEILRKPKKKVISFNPTSKGLVLTEELELLGSPEFVTVSVTDDGRIMITKNDK